MRDFYPFEKQNHYDHMKPADVALIERFIEKYPGAYDRVAYSFPVGNPPPFNPVVNDETMGSADYLYKRKIDIVAMKGNAIDIIEVKPKAGTSAIGQVLGYRDLFVRDEKPGVRPSCLIVTDDTSIDLEHVAEMQGVKIVVI